MAGLGRAGRTEARRVCCLLHSTPLMIYIITPPAFLFLFLLTSFDASIVRGTPPSMGFVLRRCDRLGTIATGSCEGSRNEPMPNFYTYIIGFCLLRK